MFLSDLTLLTFPGEQVSSWPIVINPGLRTVIVFPTNLTTVDSIPIVAFPPEIINNPGYYQDHF